MGQSQTAQPNNPNLVGQGYKPSRKPQLCPFSSETSFFRKGEEVLAWCRYPVEYKSSDLLISNNRYYTQRISLSHPHILSLYFTDFLDAQTGISVQKEFAKITNTNNWSSKKANVNTLCSLNIFDQNCKRSITNNSTAPQIKIHLYHQYESHTLQSEIEMRKKRQQRFRQKQLWELMAHAISAGRALLHSKFKEPLLSPCSIKIDSRGNYKVGEWEFTHFYEQQEEEDTYFYEEGETFLKPSSQSQKSKIHHNKPYNILTCYYWAPEGSSALQHISTLGSIDQSSSFIRKVNNNQIFSLGMTILHMCLMRPLYQKETLSQKKISSYLKQAISARSFEGLQLSSQIIKLLQQMLAWDPEERITYDQLYNQITSKRSSHTAYSVFTTENDEGLESGTFRSKKMNLLKNDKGSGSVIQGSGDTEHPLEQSRRLNLPNTLRNQVVNYQKIDFTIKRERREWQRFENRIEESSYKVQQNVSNPCNRQLFTTSQFTSAPQALVVDEEDSPNYESLCSYNPSKLVEAQKVDVESQCPSDTISKSLQNSIKLLDISNIKAEEDTDQVSKQKVSMIKFDNPPFDDRHNYSSLFSQMKKKSEANMSDSLLLKSSAIPVKMKQSLQQQQDLFTAPQLLALIRSSFSGPSHKSTRANNQNAQKNKSFLESKKIEAELCNSVYVKEQFAKGFYEGGKVDGLRSGYGTFYYNQGGKYCGDWQNNQMHGKGTLYYADGRIAYQGDWTHDSLSGKGILYNQNPVKITKSYDYTSFDQSQECWVYYQGSFHSDDKWGKGTLLLSNGEKYQGSFRNDLVEGRGIFYTLQGTRIIGDWLANKLVRIIKQQAYGNQNQN